MSTLSENINNGLLSINIKKKEAKEAPLAKNVHVFMSGKDISRLEALQKRIHPYTKKDVLLNALRLLDEIVKEVDEGSTIYIKRTGKEIEEYSIFGE